jgi:signal transduction histidine kinase
MRSVLGVLRQDGDSAPRAPTAGLARLGDLLAQARSTGLDVRLETTGDERPLPAGVDLAAFRIVQESMTNVARHSGAGTVRIKIAHGSRHIDLDIEDDGRGPGNGSGGSGISGMRERVAALGGEFSAGPAPGGGFRVSAHLPIEGD